MEFRLAIINVMLEAANGLSFAAPFNQQDL
jgi:hypothetical protein